MKYQSTKVNVLEANRYKRSLAARWPGQWLVTVKPIDTDGNFNYMPLKEVGYIFGANTSMIENLWVKAFSSNDDAWAEVDRLTEEA